jgi:hypothetical protein
MMSSADDNLAFTLKEFSCREIGNNDKLIEGSEDFCGRTEETSPTPMTPAAHQSPLVAIDGGDI